MSRPYTVGPGCATFCVIFIFIYGIFGLIVSPNDPPPGTWFCLAFGVIFILALIISSVNDKMIERNYQRQKNNQAQVSSNSNRIASSTVSSKAKSLPPITDPEQCYNYLISSLPSGGPKILRELQKKRNADSTLLSSDNSCMSLVGLYPCRETLQFIHEYNPTFAKNFSVKFIQSQHKK